MYSRLNTCIICIIIQFTFQIIVGMIVVYRLYAHELCYIHMKNNNVKKIPIIKLSLHKVGNKNSTQVYIITCIYNKMLARNCNILAANLLTHQMLDYARWLRLLIKHRVIFIVLYVRRKAWDLDYTISSKGPHRFVAH